MTMITGETPDTIYLEPRSKYDNCLLYIADGKAHYSASSIIKVLYDEFVLEHQDSARAHTEAVDWFDHNIFGSYLGEYTPVYVVG